MTLRLPAGYPQVLRSGYAPLASAERHGAWESPAAFCSRPRAATAAPGCHKRIPDLANAHMPPSRPAHVRRSRDSRGRGPGIRLTLPRDLAHFQCRGIKSRKRRVTYSLDSPPNRENPCLFSKGLSCHHSTMIV